MNRRDFFRASLALPVASAVARAVERTPPVHPPTGVTPAIAPPCPIQQTTIKTVTYRRHVGSHTHTCPRCQKAWDHSMDGNTHVCPWCKKGTEFVWDSPARMIEMHQTVQETTDLGRVITYEPSVYRFSSPGVRWGADCPPAG